MRVLLIEDDFATSRSIELTLSKADFIVDSTAFGEEGIDLAKVYDYDLILLDLSLLDMNGHEVLRNLRAMRITTPVLILTGADDTESKLKGFGLGADDYMTKPFLGEELIARIHAIVRRCEGHAEPIIRVGQLIVNSEAKSATVSGNHVTLSGKEFQILELLALRAGTPITKDTFLNHLYGGWDEPESKIIDVYICKIRKKLLKAGAASRYIDTVWGHGYVMRDPESASNETGNTLFAA